MGFCRKVAMLLGNRDAFYAEQALLGGAVFEDGKGFGDVYPILTTCISSCRNRFVTSEAGASQAIARGRSGELEPALRTQAGEILEDLGMLQRKG